MGIEVAKAFIRVRADSSKVKSDIDKAKPGAVRAASKLGGAIRQAMGAAGFAGIGFGIFKAVAAAATFEEAMVRVRANARLLGKEGEVAFRKMEKAARDLGATTRFTANEAAEAMNRLILGGLDAEQAVGALPAVLQLAASAGMDLAASAGVVIDNMIKFNLAAKDTGRIADFMSSGQSRANTTAEELAAAHLGLGQTTAALGVSFRDTTAVLLGLAQASTRGAEAGTALAVGLSRLIAAPKETADAMQELGISVRDFATGPGGALDLIGLLRAVAEAMPTDKVNRAAVAVQLFGARARKLVGVLELMQKGRFIEDTAEGLEKDLGRAARVAAARMDTFIGTIKELVSALSELAIAALTPVIKAAEPLIDVFKGISLAISKSVNAIAAVDEKMGGFIGRTIKATVAVTGLRLAIRLLGPAARLAAKAIQLAFASTGVGILIVALGVAVAGIITLIDWLKKTIPVQAAMEKAADKFKLAWERVKAAFEIVMGVIARALGLLLISLGITSARVLLVADSFAEMVGLAIGFIADFVVSATEWILALVENWSGIVRAIPVLFKAVLSFAADVFVNFFVFVLDGVKALVKGIGTAIMTIPEALKEALTPGGDVGAVIQKNMDKIVSSLPDVGDIFVSDARTLMEREINGVLKGIAESKTRLEGERRKFLKPKPTPKEKEEVKKAVEQAKEAIPKRRQLEEVGFKGLRERGRDIQTGFLESLKGPDKKDKVQADQLAVAEQSKKLQEDMLKELKDKEKGGLVAGNK